MKNYDTEDMIYALATAWNKSALAIVRVSGKGCIELLSGYFKCRKSLDSYKTNSVIFGHLYSEDGRLIDDCMISVFRNGHGFTGEDALEISCHGGLETVKAVLEHLHGLGMRQAKGGEFTLRAFLHGKMDLTQAEAVNELVNSRGSTSRTMALTRLNGALFRRISEIKDVVSDIMSIVEVQLDYAEDEISEDLTFPVDKLETAVNMISGISATYNTGRLYSQGAKVVLAGASNAGKSSLFNFFLKEERAIVSDIEGTTRDYLEASCTINGIPVRLFDTAGFRDSNDVLEEEGIRRSRNLVDDADLIIYLIDATEPNIDSKIIEDPRCITVLNKVDITDCENTNYNNYMKISVKEGTGFNALCKMIEEKLKKDNEVTSESNLVIESERQRLDLERAVVALKDAKEHLDSGLPLDIVTMDIQEALEALGEITGEVTTDDILDRIFSNFCVGK